MTAEDALKALEPSLQYIWRWPGPTFRWTTLLDQVEAALAKLPAAEHDALMSGVRSRITGWYEHDRVIPEPWHDAAQLDLHAQAATLCCHLSLNSQSAAAQAPEALAALLSSPHLQHISDLSISSVPLKGALLDALCAHKPSGITSLSLHNCGLELAAVQAMCASDRLLVGLTSLNLRNNKINAKGAALLADCAHLSTLTALNLRENPIAEAGRIALGKSAHLSTAAKISARAVASASAPAPATGDVRAAFGDLRSILQQPPSAHAWAHICDLISRLDPERAEQEALPYALSSLAAWPAEQRPLFAAWQDQVLRGEQVPPAASLSRAIVVETKGLNAERAARVGAFAAKARVEHISLFSSSPLSAKALRALLIDPPLSSLRSLRYDFALNSADAAIMFDEDAPYKLDALHMNGLMSDMPRHEPLLHGAACADLRTLSLSVRDHSDALHSLRDASWWWGLRSLTLQIHANYSKHPADALPALLGASSDPAWEALRHLTLWERPASLDLSALTPRLPALRSLDAWCGADDRLLRWLPELGQQLESLTINNINQNEQPLIDAAARLDMPALRALDLTCLYNNYRSGWGQPAAPRHNALLIGMSATPLWTQLESLRLDSINCDDEAHALILRALSPALHTLTLEDGDLGVASAHALARQPLPALRRLTLNTTHMTPEAARILTDAPWWEQLDALSISDYLSASEPSGIAALADALPAGLRELVLAGNGEAQLIPLLKAGLPAGLRTLRLHGGLVASKSFAALIAALPSLPDLHTLNLDNNTLTPKSLELLLASPHLPRIPLISILSNRLGLPGRQRVLDTHAAPISLKSNV